MAYYPTQSDLDLLFQESKKIYSKVELLNRDYLIVGSLEGQLLSDSFNIDASSSIRRTYNCRLQVSDSSFYVGADKKIWFDRWIRPYVGIYSLREKQIKWYLKGTFSYASASYAYSASDHTLSLQCSDLMCMLTGDVDGVKPSLGFSIPAGEEIRTSVIGILKTFGFTRHRIEDLPRTVPYDLEFQAGATAYEMIEKLMEFCPNYEFFFDLDGTFVIQRIPCYTDDADVFDRELFSRLLISEDDYSLNFTAKNCIEVWGKSYSGDQISRFTDTCTYTDNTYRAVFDGLTEEELTDYMILGIKVPAANQADFKVSLNGLLTFTALDDYGRTIKAGRLLAGSSYLFLYKNKQLYFLGPFTIHTQFKNESASSPFSVQNVGRELWGVCSGAEYDSITSETLAKERAMYECYYKSHLNEALSLTLVDIPWLDVNQKAAYTLRSTGETYRFMINSISGETLSGSCKVNLSRFYPDWSETFSQDNI